MSALPPGVEAAVERYIDAELSIYRQPGDLEVIREAVRIQAAELKTIGELAAEIERRSMLELHNEADLTVEHGLASVQGTVVVAILTALTKRTVGLIKLFDGHGANLRPEPTTEKEPPP